MVASTAVTSWELDYIVRGYYVYKDNREPFIGETLDCAKETSNPHDLYIFCSSFPLQIGIVIHLPRAISRVCSSFVDN